VLKWLRPSVAYPAAVAWALVTAVGLVSRPGRPEGAWPRVRRPSAASGAA
jgi:hypothetical protein